MSVILPDLKARVETDLDDETLERILDAAVKAVDRASGNATSQAETHEARGTPWIVLRRRSTGIDSIVERRRFSSDPVTLSANDYRKVGAYKLLRVSDGDNPAVSWGDQVDVTYTPEVDQDIRDRVALDLAYVDIEFKVYSEEKSGDWSGKADWMARRRELLQQVREGQAIIA